MTTSEQIERQEQLLLQAMLKSDVEQLDALISDELIFTDHTGRLLDKATDLEAHRSGRLRIDSLEPSEQHILVYNDTAVVSVLLEMQGRYEGLPTNGKLRFTRVWVNRKGTWKIVAVHSVMLNS